jgi:hypothetical protein
MQFQKFTPKTKQLAKILSGGRSSQMVDLAQKLRERPTPKFYRRGASSAGAAESSYTCNHFHKRMSRVLVSRFHKWLIPLSNHFYKRASSVFIYLWGLD